MKKKSIKKAKETEKGTFDAGATVDVFGEKVEKHDLIADGAQVQQVEAFSKTRLEDDPGEGQAAIIRCFEFALNPEAWKLTKPTKQDIFNSHLKGIEMALWKDGLKIMTEVNPRITIDSKKLRYRLFVGARPMRGHLLREAPRKLGEILHGQPN